MIPPAAAPAFLDDAGWKGARILPLAGDASFRRYFRVLGADGRTAVLMDAPPEHEDTGPFLAIAEHLRSRGFAAPGPLASDREAGLLLLEDYGDDRVGPLLAREPKREQAIYEQAITILADLGREAPPPGLPLYDEAALERETLLLIDYYTPALGLAPDRDSYLQAWRESWGAMLAETLARPVLVLRDFHADNLMVLPDGRLGLLDFQDALAGHRAYDLVSLLQDARRDVTPKLEEAMIALYCDRAGIEDQDAFRAHYELLGAQRNAKIIGIFSRLFVRDGKPIYLGLQPRVWAYLERNLAHPALASMRDWFAANIPAEQRVALSATGVAG